MRLSRIRINTGAAGPVTHVATGALTAQSAAIAGTAAVIKKHAATGTLTAQSATITGAAARTREHDATGALTSQDATIAGSAARAGATDHVATGSLIAQAAAISGTAVVIKKHDATGSLIGQSAAIAGTAAVIKTHASTGALIAQSAVINGLALNGTATAIPGGGGRGSSRSGYKNFVSRDQERKVIKDITALITVEKEDSYIPGNLETVSPEGVERVVQEVVKTYDPLPAMKRYDIGRPEALSNIEDYTRIFIARKNDDAMAMAIIMGMI